MIELIKSFLNVLLPKDEYKRMGMLYFISEAAIIVMLTFIILNVANLFFKDLKNVLDIILLILTFFMFIYPTSRYILLGMEYGDITSMSNYKMARKKGVFQSIGTGALFGFFMFLFKGFPSMASGLFEVIMMTFLFTISYLAFTLLSLNRSFKKNKSLMDD